MPEDAGGRWKMPEDLPEDVGRPRKIPEDLTFYLTIYYIL